MGQKVNPIGFRIGRFGTWKSRWFDVGANYKESLIEDVKIRRLLMDKLKLAGIESVEIERLPKSIVINLICSRPGVVIGRGGSGIEDIKKQILKLMGPVRSKSKIDLHVTEIKNPEISAHLVAMRIAGELERRMPSRRVVTKTMERVMQSGAKGVKILLAGRINGADIARQEPYHIGSVPTQTMRKNIDYAAVPALLKRGYVGVKVWIYKEEN